MNVHSQGFVDVSAPKTADTLGHHSFGHLTLSLSSKLILARLMWKEERLEHPSRLTIAGAMPLSGAVH